MKTLHNYDDFVDKFKTKFTTDDCYTPPSVYDAILGWVKNQFDIDGNANILRPFYIGGDFEKYDYKKGNVVVDNPPFSIMKKIVAFYKVKGVPFFLFAPTLTLFNYIDDATCIACHADIIYQNGAKVATSFVTNMYKENYAFTIEPSLRDAIEAAVKEISTAKHFTKLVHPINVTSGALIGKFAKVAASPVRIKRESVKKISTVDNYGKLYGTGILLSDRVANEISDTYENDRGSKKSIDRGTQYSLSDREKEIISKLV